MDERRFAMVLFGIALGVVTGFIAVWFIAPLTISVFLYYSTRRYHKALRSLRLPARVRAVVVLSSLAVPLLVLVGYSVILLLLEARDFVDQYGLVTVAATRFEWFSRVEDLPEFTAQGLYQAYQSGQLDPFITFATENASFVSELAAAFFLNLFVVVIVTYYLLVDGARIREWLLRFDEEAIIREYLEAVDAELEAVLFGNLLNVIAISLIAIAAFNGYNLLVAAPAEVPYPSLVGALTGVASLVPVVGMKIVYLPATGIAAIPVLVSGDLALLGYIAGLLVVAVVIVDTIPDLVLRPLLSGKTTHVGLLMLAYTLGPVVLGFYGLFFAPILLVVGLTFANTALPRLLGARPNEVGIHENQLRLGDF
jgi:predicted PurR-regulated permease PerM